MSSVSSGRVEESDLLVLHDRIARALDGRARFDETELARWKWFAERKGTTFERLLLDVFKTRSSVSTRLENASRSREPR